MDYAFVQITVKDGKIEGRLYIAVNNEYHETVVHPNSALVAVPEQVIYSLVW